MPRKLENLVGCKLGKLTVLQYAGLVPTGSRRQSAWACKCDCGNEAIVRNNNLKRGIATSCGCYQKQRAFESNLKNISGQRFGMLQVVKYIETRKRIAFWLCKCDCGNESLISTNALNRQKSCGCRQGWWRSAKPGLWKDKAAYSRWQRENPVRKLRNSVSNSIRVMIKKNGSYKRKKSIRNYLPYTIEELKTHLESLWGPWMNWDNYGGRSNDPRKTWHIDHIIPHQSFAYKTMNDPLFLECWSLKNLRPLEKKENISKGCKKLA